MIIIIIIIIIILWSPWSLISSWFRLHSRHNQINDLLCRAFVSSGTLAPREPQGLCTNTGKRPDGVTQRFHGDEVDAWLGMLHAQTHSLQVTCWQAATRPALPLQQLKSTKHWSTTTSSQVLTSCRWLSKRLVSGEDKVSNSSTKSVVVLRQWHMNPVQQLSFANISRWQCSVGTHTSF